MKITTASAKQDLEAMLHGDGWTRDRFGHYRKTITWADKAGCHTKEFRFKMKKLACRIESLRRLPATDYSPATVHWANWRSFYYKELPGMLRDGQLVVGPLVVGRV